MQLRGPQIAKPHDLRSADHADAMRPTTTLAESFSRLNRTDNLNPLNSAQLGLVAITIPAGTIVTNIIFCSGTTAAVNPTHQWFCLYNSSLGKLGVTGDDTTTAWAGNAEKSLALSSPFTTTYGGLHYAGLCVVAGTVPSLTALAYQNATLAKLATVTAGNADTALSVPADAPTTATAITGGNTFFGHPYVRIT